MDLSDQHDSDDDDNDDNLRRSTRTRTAPTSYTDDHSVPDSQWHSKVQAMVDHGFRSTSVLMTLTTLFSPSVWFDQNLVQSIQTYDAARHEDTFLRQLACGQPVADPLFSRNNFCLDALVDMYGEQAGTDKGHCS